MFMRTLISSLNFSSETVYRGNLKENIIIEDYVNISQIKYETEKQKGRFQDLCLSGTALYSELFRLFQFP